MYKVLSIDGGGIKGLIPAVILSEIEKQTGQPIASLFDLIVGTSTGGILAMGLTLPGEEGRPKYSAQDGIGLYEQHGSTVFPPPAIPVWSEFRLKLFDEKYPAQGLVRVLNSYFSNSRLGDALTPIVISTYDLTARKPRFFKSDRHRDKDHLMWQVARATSAAPTFFEPHLLLNPDGEDSTLIDGGVFANSPAMCAYAEALDRRKGQEDILLVSLGTGYGIHAFNYEDVKDWGQVQWAMPLIKILFDSMGATVHYQLQRLLPERDGQRYYYRFQSPLPAGHDSMDNINPKNIEVLRSIAGQLLAHSKRSGTFDDLCRKLTS